MDDHSSVEEIIASQFESLMQSEESEQDQYELELKQKRFKVQET